MFHRANKSDVKPEVDQRKDQPFNQNHDKLHNHKMEQTAVQRYAKFQDENNGHNNQGRIEQKLAPNTANQNGTDFYTVAESQHSTPHTTRQTKEVEQMNNPQTKDQTENQTNTSSAPSQTQGRVDIPGQNFQRPGMPTGQTTRPAYPGSAYPGSSSNNSTPSYGASHANDRSTGPKLVIGQGITLSGEIEACDHLIVEGTIEASLKGASILDVAESGSYFGTVEIEEANIAGRFEGDITVNGRLTIESTGTIIGSVSYKELSMEAGATLDGTVSPIGSENAGRQSAKRPAPSKSKKATNNGAELPFADRSAAE